MRMMYSESYTSTSTHTKNNEISRNKLISVCFIQGFILKIILFLNYKIYLEYVKVSSYENCEFCFNICTLFPKILVQQNLFETCVNVRKRV